MNENDDIILEYLLKISPAAEAPTAIHFNLDRCAGELDYYKRTDGGISLDTVRNRIRRLEDIGLVEIVREKGKYRAITDDGEAYLTGELDASELEPE